MRLRNSGVAAAALLLAMGGCRPAVVETGPAAPPPATLPIGNVVPSGTVMDVQLNQRLDTRTTQVGQRFTATVTSPLRTAAGVTLVPAGSVVQGTVTGVQPSERMGDPAAIRLDFDRLQVGTRTYPFSAEIVETGVEARPRIGRAPVVGAAAGAVLGTIVGRGSLLERLLIGGLLGAGIGTIIALGTGDVDAALPEGTTMRLQTTEAVAIQ